MNDEPRERSMSCEHSTSDDLFLHLRRERSKVDRHALEQHLSGCPACRERLETLQWIQGQVERWGMALFADHIPSETLVRFTENPEDLPVSLRSDLERHLALCESCSRDLRMVEEVGASLEEAPTPLGIPWRDRLLGFLSGGFGPAPAWAAALIVLLILPAGLGIRAWLDGDRRPAEAVRTLPASQLLQADSERNGRPSQILRAPAAGPLVVEIHVAVLDAEGVRYDAQLLSEEGDLVWGRQDLRSVDGFGSFLLLLDADILSPGPYRLEVTETRSDRPDTEHFEFRFELHRD